MEPQTDQDGSRPRTGKPKRDGRWFRSANVMRVDPEPAIVGKGMGKASRPDSLSERGCEYKWDGTLNNQDREKRREE